MTQPEPLQWFTIVNPHPNEIPDAADVGRIGYLARKLTIADDPDLRKRQFVIVFADGTEGAYAADEIKRVFAC